MTCRISCIRLLVDKFDECFGFYRDVLGAEVVWGNPGEAYAEFRVGDDATHLALFRRELSDAAIGVSSPHPLPERTDRVALIIEVDDVGAWADRLSSHNVENVCPCTERRDWGVRTAHFRDPDGNLIEVNQPLET